MSSVRTPAFTKAEEAIIKDGYVEFKDTIDAPFSATITKFSKDLAWSKITERVNGTGIYNRTHKQVIKKFKNLKNDLKSKMANERRSASTTGGGPPLKEVSIILHIFSF